MLDDLILRILAWPTVLYPRLILIGYGELSMPMLASRHISKSHKAHGVSNVSFVDTD